VVEVRLVAEVDGRNALDWGVRVLVLRQVDPPDEPQREPYHAGPDDHRRGCTHGSAAPGGRGSGAPAGCAWLGGGQSRRGGVMA
jgi:hypothetical protein